ncbi:hypothetical protein PP935_gp100 [Rhizobium phage RHph_N34]|uniref:Uncharacterized protein n=1 Tax=Rhizobium phage RHph_N34 TaxID=2509586 RepID=A0A7S5UX13_9CAUD|nr:hypothetical protein PP935_gp100 [Rhizobium phage RHph_N34]QIG73875.1 hypothetical protein EVC06_100 [Rhizobium phage RHph_N34]
MFYIVQNLKAKREECDLNPHPVFGNPYVDQIGVRSYHYGNTPSFLLVPINQLKQTHDVWNFETREEAEEAVNSMNGNTSHDLEVREGEFVWSKAVKKMRAL